MQWWNDFVDWVSSDTGWKVVTDAVVPFVAIVVAGVIAALIGRAATRRVVTLHEDEAKTAAVAGLIGAARKSAVWSSLGTEERSHSDHLAHEAEVRLRLLPVTGSSLAANWVEHELAEMKRHSVSFSFQAEQSLAEFRDRLVEWQDRPGRAKKLFRDDLTRWKHEAADHDEDVAARQRAWDAEQTKPVAADEAYRAPASPPPTQVGPSPASAPEAPSSAGSSTAVDPSPSVESDDTRDDQMDDERYGQPVSASQVRQRTAPRSDD